MRNQHIARILKTAGTAAGALVLLIGLMMINTGWSWLTDGDPAVPQLTGRWWAGYYDTTFFGRVWCVARFFRGPSGQLGMALLSPFGRPDIFQVDRDTGDEYAVRLRFVDRSVEIDGKPVRMEIDGEQLYKGERYFVGRLLAGRFDDFWKENDDIRILGYLAPRSSHLRFAIEPIGEQKLSVFWYDYVRPERGAPSPRGVLAAAGVRF